ncbi:hypothetical protein [Methylobacterium radiotolerans]|uniref:hypothetical protein n=1 Tax=Methylobacterium radiotolerans TaxID=31998 RepID=UPI0015F71157|nr:hypothetical protein [Methylobacterium radiotolerans]
MGTSAASINISSTPVKHISRPPSRNDQSKQTELWSRESSADPRTAKHLSPHSADAILGVSSIKDVNSNRSGASTNSKDSSETTYRTASYDLYNDGEVILPEQSVTAPGDSPSGGDGPGSTAGTTAPIGGGGSPSTTGTSDATSVVDDGDHAQITWELASETTYQSLLKENPRNAEIGDENQGAVAVAEHSERSPDGSIWSEGKIILKTQKGVFWASPSTPGGVIFAKLANGTLEITSGHKA